MARGAGIIIFVLTMAVAAASFGEIVKATSARTMIYDGEQYLRVKIEGKRFMVYTSMKDREGATGTWSG